MIVVARPIIRVGYENWMNRLWRDESEHLSFEEKIEQRLDSTCVQMIGPWLIFFGTLIWGYGDLIAEVGFGPWQSN